MYPPRGAIVLLFLVTLLCFAQLITTRRNRATEGTVVDDHGPVAGAIVRRQRSGTHALSDALGRFRLPGPSHARHLTAAKEGFLIAAAAPDASTLRLTQIPDDDNDAYAWIEPVPNPRKAHNCGNCHQQVYDEWSASAHARSATNPKFLHQFAGTDGAGAPAATWNVQKEHPLGSGVCAACHAPTLTSPDLDYDVRQARGVDRQGVHCDYCHKIADAPLDKLGTRFGRDGYRVVRPHNDLQLFFGPLDDAVRAGESFAYAPLYKESRYCASCHEGIVFGVHVYGTYSEWLASPARQKGQQCQDCHMAPTGTMTNIAPGKGGVERAPKTLASHGLADAKALLATCLSVKTATTREEGKVVVRVTTLARNVGHRVPTGFIDRHLILIVEAFGKSGQAISQRDGAVLPERAGEALAGRAGWIFGKQHVNKDGRPVPFWLSADELLDTRLAPEVADVQSFAFDPGAKTVRVRLIYRRFWDEVAQSRSWTDHEQVVKDETVTIKNR